LRKINADLPRRAAVFASSREDLLSKLEALNQRRHAPGPGPGVAEEPLLATPAADSRAPAVKEWLAGRGTLHSVPYEAARPCLRLPRYAFEHDFEFNASTHAAALSSARELASHQDVYRAIFQRVAQGELSKEEAWKLIHTTET
jgi:hypothetical protein